METMTCMRCETVKPITSFAKNRYGITRMCKDCVNELKSIARARTHNKKVEKIAAEIANARNLKLADFTPRELMDELKRRGYKGTLTFTETRTINLDTL